MSQHIFSHELKSFSQNSFANAWDKLLLAAALQRLAQGSDILAKQLQSLDIHRSSSLDHPIIYARPLNNKIALELWDLIIETDLDRVRTEKSLNPDHPCLSSLNERLKGKTAKMKKLKLSAELLQELTAMIKPSFLSESLKSDIPSSQPTLYFSEEPSVDEEMTSSSSSQQADEYHLSFDLETCPTVDTELTAAEKSTKALEESAKKSWEKIFSRYSQAIQSLAYSPEQLSTVIRNNTLRATRFSPTEARSFETAILAKLQTSASKEKPEKIINQTATFLQHKFRYYLFTKPNIRIPANNLKHGAHIAHFVRQEHVHMQLNSEKQLAVLLALDQAEGDNYHRMFRNSELPEIALGLYMRKKITLHQFSTILNRLDALADFPLEHRARIIDDSGNWTSAGLWLLTELEQTNHSSQTLSQPLTPQQLENFKYLVKTSPRSEQFFDLFTIAKPIKDELMQKLYDNLSLLRTSDKTEKFSYIFLSSAISEALLIAATSVEKVALILPQLGKFPPQLIIDSLRHRLRPEATHFPGASLPYGIKKSLHGFKLIFRMSGAKHDRRYHLKNLSFIPPEISHSIYQLYERCKFLINERSLQKIDLSLELWDYGDCDYGMFSLHKTGINPFDASTIRKATILFCNYLFYGNGTTAPTWISCGGYLLRTKQTSILAPNQIDQLSTSPENWEITLLGVLFFIDLINNPSHWPHIDPQFFVEPFASHFKTIQKIFSSVKDDIPLMQIFKYENFSFLATIGREEEWSKFSRFIDLNQSHFLDNLRIDKSTRDSLELSDYPLPNTLFISYKNEKLSTHLIDFFHAFYQSMTKEKDPTSAAKNKKRSREDSSDTLFKPKREKDLSPKLQEQAAADFSLPYQ